MTVGWKYGKVDGKPVAVRICYIRAWDDHEWRKVNGIENGPRKGGRRPRKTDQEEPMRTPVQIRAGSDQ